MRRVLPWQQIAQSPKKCWCILLHKWKRKLDSHRQNKYHSRRKTAYVLPRPFSMNINKTLSFSTVWSPVDNRFVRETFTHCEYYICSLKVLYTNSVFRAVARKKRMTKAMSMKNLWLRQLVHGRVLFLAMKSLTTKEKEMTEASASVGLLIATALVMEFLADIE